MRSSETRRSSASTGSRGRERALHRARESGVALSKLTSSWAPFLVHAISMLRPGGRIAMVVPAELGYAAYAAPLLRHLKAGFAEVTLLSFREKLFRDLSEDTFLLLADGRGRENVSCRLLDFENGGRLAFEGFAAQNNRLEADLDLEAIAAGERRLTEAFVPAGAAELYRLLCASPDVRTLGSIADVGIGYVTGANAFFHLTPSQVARWAVPAEVLRRAVFRGKALKGTSFTEADWQSSLNTGDSGYLVSTSRPESELPEGLRAYLAEGERTGVPQGFKCRTRKPWYAVPHVREPDAFLTYMSGRRPRMAINEMAAVAPNTLHVIQMRDRADRDRMIVGWHSALARLSLEIEGHALGGGMLKVEPTEAERIRLPLAADGEAAEVIDGLVRAGREREARRAANELTLVRGLGLSWADCERLEQAAEELASRRDAKSRAA